jgi:hypothetical protein
VVLYDVRAFNSCCVALIFAIYSSRNPYVERAEELKSINTALFNNLDRFFSVPKVSRYHNHFIFADVQVAASAQ